MPYRENTKKATDNSVAFFCLERIFKYILGKFYEFLSTAGLAYFNKLHHLFQHRNIKIPFFN